MSDNLLGQIDPHFLPLPQDQENENEKEAEEQREEDQDSGEEEEECSTHGEQETEEKELENALLTKVAQNLRREHPGKFQDQEATKKQLLSDITKKVNEGGTLVSQLQESEECFQEYQRFYSKYGGPRQKFLGKEDGDSENETPDGDWFNNGSSAKKRKRSSKKPSLASLRKAAKEKPTKVTDMKGMDLPTIPHDSCILLASKRRGGKSYAIISILLALSLPRLVLFGKGRDSAFWLPYVKQMYIYSEFDEDKFAAILRDQEQLLNLTKKPGFEHLDIDLAIILEDFSYDDQVMRSKAISDLVSNGRRLHMLFLCSAQYLKSIKPKVRTQFDLFFLFQEKNADVRKILYDACGAYFDSKDEFFKILDATATNRRCLVINNSSDKTDRTEDFTKFFKSKTPLEKRELGSLLYRMFAELYFMEPLEENETPSSMTPEGLSELAKPKVIMKIPNNEHVPIHLIEETANKQGTFEVYCLSGKNEQHIISFSHDEDQSQAT